MIPTMKGLISQGTRINPKNTAKLEKGYKEGYDKVTSLFLKSHADYLLKVKCQRTDYAGDNA